MLPAINSWTPQTSLRDGIGTLCCARMPAQKHPQLADTACDTRQHVAGLPSHGLAVLRPCDASIAVLATSLPGSKHPVLAVSVRAPLLALQASLAALAAAHALATAYGAPPGPGTAGGRPTMKVGGAHGGSGAGEALGGGAGDALPRGGSAARQVPGRGEAAGSGGSSGGAGDGPMLEQLLAGDDLRCGRFRLSEAAGSPPGTRLLPSAKAAFAMAWEVRMAVLPESPLTVSWRCALCLPLHLPERSYVVKTVRTTCFVLLCFSHAQRCKPQHPFVTAQVSCKVHWYVKAPRLYGEQAYRFASV